MNMDSYVNWNWPLTGEEIVPEGTRWIACYPESAMHLRETCHHVIKSHSMASNPSALTRCWFVTASSVEAVLMPDVPAPLVCLALGRAGAGAAIWQCGTGLLPHGGTVSELIEQTAEVNYLVNEEHSEYPRPPLVLEPTRSWLPWAASVWLRYRAQRRWNAVEIQAVESGLRLLQGDYHGCHQAAQNIEGCGRHHGDYWHAILHRCEPDYGNARYWFRQVGEQHPVFSQLAEHVLHASDIINTPCWQRWHDRLIRAGRWQPFAFLQAVEAAVHTGDESLCDTIREIQYREMLLLFAQTVRDAAT
ncbi:MAG: hypothetical protein KatS3mg113_0721 [Planctomycetaceae bacterium]|nr:MAG: hypothetical protein KatS3mg113_0721 [Planctomycetaceae bacterium]